MPVLDLVAWDDPAAARLRVAQQAELRERYGDDDIGHAMTGEQIVAMVLLRSSSGEAVACGALRDAPDLGAATAELKRMFVLPDHRGRGHSRAVLVELERIAAERGYDRLVLETGPRQPEAIGLYLSAGYVPTENYGEYVGVLDSRCFAKDLRAVPGVRGPARPGVVVTLDRVPWTDPDASYLRHRMYTQFNAPTYPELAAMIADVGGFWADDEAQGVGDLGTWVARVDGRPVGCVSLRAPRDGYPAGSAELKKLYIEADARGAGVARALLAAVDEKARSLGFTDLVLQTGIRQPEAIRLYLATGWRPIAPFGPYESDLHSLCFGKPLAR
ncbi:GNAT family N-acetyltransferase [Cellulomonas edaphi]|uniref:GNAT family N-acetyltransferase n=1 Tax=Cellulomonas edaphi TaxID=3053468 RepID=A0ABT7S2E6_9CELL|nr:GNAT family N-acetyltransferase [Cellulomons edaphi]MDM7829719.1 GNAT family N-acetyltransferase [Cellulomons edaphi]